MVIKTLKKKKKEEMYWFHYISSFILFTLLVDNFFKTQKLTIHTRGRKKQERKKKNSLTFGGQSRKLTNAYNRGRMLRKNHAAKARQKQKS